MTIFLEKVVLVFKTNVHDLKIARWLVTELQQHFPMHRINFDLDDCDRILRIEGQDLEEALVAAMLHAKGYECSILE